MEAMQMTKARVLKMPIKQQELSMDMNTLI